MSGAGGGARPLPAGGGGRIRIREGRRIRAGSSRRAARFFLSLELGGGSGRRAPPAGGSACVVAGSVRHIVLKRRRQWRSRRSAAAVGRLQCGWLFRSVRDGRAGRRRVLFVRSGRRPWGRDAAAGANDGLSHRNHLWADPKDVISIPKTNENYRLLYDTKGRFCLHPIRDEDAKAVNIVLEGSGDLWQSCKL